MKNTALCLAALLLLPICSNAEEEREPIAKDPLPVRNLLSDEGDWFFSMGFGYANGNTNGLNVINNTPMFDYAILAVTSTQNSQTNSDALSVTPSLRYGFTNDTNLTVSLAFAAYQSRTQSGAEITSSSDSRFSSSQLSLSHNFIREGDTPALIGSVGVNVVENVGITTDDYDYAKSWSFGLSSYRVFDPIVINGSVGYLLSLERTTEQTRTDPGDVFFVNGGVSFIPNPNSSLSAGFSWAVRDKDKINGVKQGIIQTTTSLNLGMGYEWSKQTNLFLNVGMIASGGDGASVSLSISHDFAD